MQFDLQCKQTNKRQVRTVYTRPSEDSNSVSREKMTKKQDYHRVQKFKKHGNLLALFGGQFAKSQHSMHPCALIFSAMKYAILVMAKKCDFV